MSTCFRPRTSVFTLACIRDGQGVRGQPHAAPWPSEHTIKTKNLPSTETHNQVQQSLTPDTQGIN